MKRSFKLLSTGTYIGDFRYDEGIRIRDGNVSPCLRASQGISGGLSIQPLVVKKDEDGHISIRYLTPKECFRLQGFSDELFERAARINNDKQLWKQAGNSVTVSVIYEIAKRL